MNYVLFELIEELINNNSGSVYIPVIDSFGDKNTIRVSNHRGNSRNGSTNPGRLISFVSCLDRKQDIQVIDDEYCIVEGVDKNYDSISDILKNYDINPNQIVNI